MDKMEPPLALGSLNLKPPLFGIQLMQGWRPFGVLLLLIFGLIGFAGASGIAIASEEAERPNVVFLYTDDQAHWALGAYGNREIQTPNLDRLASEGALFRNAFTTTPVCSPSRASMFASRYSSELGIGDWINPRTEPDLGLAPEVIGWPELLQGNGYKTGLFGKWHLGTLDRFHPTRQGLEHFFGFRGGGNRPMDPELEFEGEVRHWKGSLPDLLVEHGLAFLEAHHDQPFLLAIHFRAPHTPYAPVPEEDSALYRDLDPTIPDVPGLPVERVKKLTREYYASISSVDRNVGRLLDRLDTLGLTDKTIVIFTSDHGYMIGHHGLWHKGNASWLLPGHQGHRPNMFEESIRVPLIIRWPGQIAPGQEPERLASNIDLFPTILDLVGLGVPENLSIAGQSLADLLLGQEADAPMSEDVAFFGQYDMHHYQEARMRMIRTSDWKLIRHFEPDGVDELYDLAKDPGETRNLAASEEHRDRFESLNERLRAWMVSINDPLIASDSEK